MARARRRVKNRPGRRTPSNSTRNSLKAREEAFAVDGCSSDI
jgi:hypothetical protein